jgi:hypothetical protein
VLAPFAPAMRLAMLYIAYSGLGAALVMAPFATPMRHAVVGAALNRLGAALVLAPPAPSMRNAVLRGAFGSLDAGRVLAALAPAMHAAVPRVITSAPFITSAPCRLERTWSSPPSGSACPRRARCSAPYRL